MLLTEEQAKEKWCPMTHKHVSVIFSSDNEPLPETVQENLAKANCLASGCMMWRWPSYDDDADPTNPATRRGFCGLAVRP